MPILIESKEKYRQHFRGRFKSASRTGHRKRLLRADKSAIHLPIHAVYVRHIDGHWDPNPKKGNR